jgi:transcriptional regulator with XRE-family HTH domain
MGAIFSMRMAQTRREQGISQKQAAGGLGVSQALLSHYEKGIRECGLDFVVRASNYYGVTCDYLLGKSDSKNGLSLESGKGADELDMITVYR